MNYAWARKCVDRGIENDLRLLREEIERLKKELKLAWRAADKWSDYVKEKRKNL